MKQYRARHLHTANSHRPRLEVAAQRARRRGWNAHPAPEPSRIVGCTLSQNRTAAGPNEDCHCRSRQWSCYPAASSGSARPRVSLDAPDRFPCGCRRGCSLGRQVWAERRPYRVRQVGHQELLPRASSHSYDTKAGHQPFQLGTRDPQRRCLPEEVHPVRDSKLARGRPDKACQAGERDSNHSMGLDGQRLSQLTRTFAGPDRGTGDTPCTR